MPLSTLVGTTGTRWARRRSVPNCQGPRRLDLYQCRTWTAWHGFTALAMAALAILVAITTARPPAAGLIALTVPETRRMLITTDDRAIAWSLWRRRHQAIARAGHTKHHTFIESEHVTR